MTSDISFILKFIHQYDQSTPNRLLSPIIETSVEKKSPSPILPENRSINNDQTNQILLDKCQAFLNHFEQIQSYLNRLDEHFHALSFLVQHLRRDEHFNDSIEFLEIRLVQMRVKRDQIDRSLNQSSLQNLIKQICPLLLQSQSMIDYPQLFTSIQLSLNQKTILIDHVRNDYRYRKYRLNEYSMKYQQQQDLLFKLIKQIEQYLVQHQPIIGQKNLITIDNQDNRQSRELIQLSKEYDELQHEYELLTFQIKENLRKFSA